jgi:hypothetical protein
VRAAATLEPANDDPLAGESSADDVLTALAAEALEEPENEAD